MSMLPKARDEAAERPKAMLLFLLPLPLLAVLLGQIVDGKVFAALTTAGALAGFYTGAGLVRKGLIQELILKQRRHIANRPTPFKLLGSALVSAATFATAWLLGDVSVFESLGYAAGALGGSLLLYGLDAQPKTVATTVADQPDVVKALAQAEQKILRIEEANQGINCVELTDRLNRITDKAREVVDVLAEKPDKLRRARRFLSTYLDGAEKVADGYARTHSRTQSQELDDNFRQVLVTIEDVFQEQYDKLLEDDVLDLDVQIEVLQTQLEREGVG